MQQLYKHIYNHRYLYSVGTFTLLLILLVFPTDTYAQWGMQKFIDALDGFFAGLLNWLNRFQFWVLDQFILPLIEAAMEYDSFFNDGVKAGYNVIRDFANLLLGLLLLFIAIGTVLDFGPFSEYNIKSKLPNFILSALLINYSLTLIAVGIDISQIIMIEFYNAIVAGGSLADHLASFTNLAMTNQGNKDTIESIGGAVADSHIVLSLVIMAITAVINVVFLWFAAILVHRIAILMMLSMTAPLAFISNLFPPLKAFWSQWIKFLSSALLGGPVLMFMIYLAMQVFAAGSAATGNEFSIFNFALAIILLIIALQKSGEFTEGMPSVAKKAVAYAAGAATGGLGGYVAGQNSAATTDQEARFLGNQAKRAGQWTDKGVGGITRTADVLTRGRANLNARYEKGKEKTEKSYKKSFLSEEGQKKGYEKRMYDYAEDRIQNGKGDSDDYKRVARQEKQELDQLKEDNMNEDKDALSGVIKDPKETKAKKRAAYQALSKLDGGLDTLVEKFPDVLAKYDNKIDAIDEVLNQSLEEGRDTPTDFDKKFRKQMVSNLNKEGDKSKNGLNPDKRSGGQSASEASIKTLSNMSSEETAKNMKASMFFRASKRQDASGNPIKDQNGNTLYDHSSQQFSQIDLQQYLDNMSPDQIEDPKTWNKTDQETKRKLCSFIPATTSQPKLLALRTGLNCQ